jgi:hypothetical protein
LTIGNFDEAKKNVITFATRKGGAKKQKNFLNFLHPYSMEEEEVLDNVKEDERRWGQKKGATKPAEAQVQHISFVQKHNKCD